MRRQEKETGRRWNCESKFGNDKNPDYVNLIERVELPRMAKLRSERIFPAPPPVHVANCTQ